MTYLNILLYWVSFNYKHYEQLTEISTFNIIYDNAQLLTELIKILNFFKIKNKFFEIIIENASNNNILKKEFKKL